MRTLATIGPASPVGDIDPATVAHGRAVIASEIEGLRQLAAILDNEFARAIRVLRSTAGRVVVSGVGKSGHIALKIASTLASTGTPAFFLHPLEAAHGDLGMMTAGDTALLLSNSGETPALMPIVDHAARIGAPLVVMGGRPAAALMLRATVALRLPAAPEACALGVAPTTSTTAMLALGDALAVALMRVRGFSQERFGELHPGGAAGLRLRSVASLMHGGDRLPLVAADARIEAIVAEVNAKGFGVTGVVDGHGVKGSGALIGVITDGDIRRNVERLGSAMARELMHAAPRTIAPDAPLEAALASLRAHRITSLFVLADGESMPVGLVHLHDFLRAGLA